MLRYNMGFELFSFASRCIRSKRSKPIKLVCSIMSLNQGLQYHLCDCVKAWLLSKADSRNAFQIWGGDAVSPILYQPSSLFHNLCF